MSRDCVIHRSSVHLFRPRSRLCHRRTAVLPRRPGWDISSCREDILPQKVLAMYEGRERKKENLIKKTSKGVRSAQMEVKLGPSCLPRGGTHTEEHSPKTPAGQWPHLLFGPGSVGSETGSEKLRGYGRGRWPPPSSFGHRWPQDATPQPLESPGERWKPTGVSSPDLFDLIRYVINRSATFSIFRERRDGRGAFTWIPQEISESKATCCRRLSDHWGD